MTGAAAPVSGARPRPRWFRRHPRLALGSIVVLGTLAIDVGSAAVLRAFGLWHPGHPDSYYRTSHPVYHHTLKRNVAFDGARWGSVRYPIRTNSLGFRDREVRDVALRPQGRRIVLIGDSFTEGLGLAWEDTFAGMIAERLAEQGTEVLNAGVVSYAPTIYSSKVRHLVEHVRLEFDHLVVFLDLSDVHDEYRYYRVEQQGAVVRAEGDGPEGVLKRFIADHTILLGAARDLIRRLRLGDDQFQRADTGAQLGQNRCLWTLDPEAFDRYGREGLAAATARMDELAAFLAERGIRLTVVVYPWPDQIARRDLESRQVVHWREWARRHGAGFVDCFPAFIDERPAAEVIEAHFIPGDVHYNRAGNAVIAERVLRHLTP